MLMLCPICAGEFETVSGVCAGCGCALVPSTLNREHSEIREPEQAREIRFVELCRPRTFPEAMLVKATLEENHVTVMIRGANSLSMMPHLAFGGQLRVLVDSAQLEYAKALYKAYFESEEEIDYIAEE